MLDWREKPYLEGFQGRLILLEGVAAIGLDVAAPKLARSAAGTLGNSMQYFLFYSSGPCLPGRGCYSTKTTTHWCTALAGGMGSRLPTRVKGLPLAPSIKVAGGVTRLSNHCGDGEEAPYHPLVLSVADYASILLRSYSTRHLRSRPVVAVSFPPSRPTIHPLKPTVQAEL